MFEVAVGHEGRDLDELVRTEPKPRHFAIDPYQFVLHEKHSSQGPSDIVHGGELPARFLLEEDVHDG